jgi:hypothetical protein
MRLISGGMALMVLQDESGTKNNRTVTSKNVLIMENLAMAQLQLWGNNLFLGIQLFKTGSIQYVNVTQIIILTKNKESTRVRINMDDVFLRKD